ncbi:HDOD domain-containing protein [Methylophaga sp.]|uniref:HDOD domain-containing protein n=1 Tax=Methylophaga sp. TaxID=2024840 RepID=UPI003F6A4DE6
MQDISETKAESITSQFRIPPKPTVLIALQQELDKTDPDPVDFANVIEQDVALSAVVLKTVNSPAFGLNRKLSNIRQAVVMIGADKLNHLITYFTLRQSLSGKASISLEKFWDNTMEVATMSRFVHRLFADRVSAPPDDLYALGLFRDCGIPLMAMKYSNYKDVLFEANHSPHHVFTEVEEEHYGTNHAIVGYFVASSWNIPKTLYELVLRHHEPDFLQQTTVSESQKDLYCLIKIASNAATQYKYGKVDSEWPITEELVLTHLKMSDHDYQEMMADLLDEYYGDFGELG